MVIKNNKEKSKSKGARRDDVKFLPNALKAAPPSSEA